MSPDPDGTVITFYSYKGGTGRTMALANVAWILAANGQAGAGRGLGPGVAGTAPLLPPVPADRRRCSQPAGSST